MKKIKNITTQKLLECGEGGGDWKELFEGVEIKVIEYEDSESGKKSVEWELTKGEKKGERESYQEIEGEYKRKGKTMKAEWVKSGECMYFGFASRKTQELYENEKSEGGMEGFSKAMKEGFMRVPQDEETRRMCETKEEFLRALKKAVEAGEWIGWNYSGQVILTSLGEWKGAWRELEISERYVESLEALLEKMVEGDEMKKDIGWLEWVDFRKAAWINGPKTYDELKNKVLIEKVYDEGDEKGEDFVRVRYKPSQKEIMDRVECLAPFDTIIQVKDDRGGSVIRLAELDIVARHRGWTECMPKPVHAGDLKRPFRR